MCWQWFQPNTWHSVSLEQINWPTPAAAAVLDCCATIRQDLSLCFSFSQISVFLPFNRFILAAQFHSQCILDMEHSNLPSHQFHSTAVSIFRLQDNGGGEKKKKTTWEILFGSAFRREVCSHLKTQEKRWNSYFKRKKKKRIPSLDRFTHEINLWQYHKEFIWMGPDDPRGSMNEVWVHRSWSGLPASPPLRLAVRAQLHFSFGSSLDVAISVRGQAALGLWPKAKWFLSQSFSLSSAWSEKWTCLQDERRCLDDDLLVETAEWEPFRRSLDEPSGA